MVSSEIPPHRLQLVIDFVNTLDVETGDDQMTTPADLIQWLHEQGLTSGDLAALGAAQLAEAIELREGLRLVLVGHTNGGADEDAGATMERVAARGRLSVCIDPDGSVRIAPRESGYAGVLAQLLVPVAHAALDGSWQRVKACDADDCLEAFYDQSRNRSGRWCDMAVCGNRTKVRAYRTKRSSEPAA
jgi:predicted RNA-binding Zn ribbon-like protein